jgi:penicillin-binding protein 1A
MDITTPVTPPKRGRKKKRRGFFLRFLGFMFAAGMILAIGVAGAVAFVLWKASQDLPDYEVLAKYEPPVMTRIHANDGRLISEFARQRRIYVPITAVPKRVIEAFLSAEDKNFYQHGGLDIQGIIRAIVTNMSAMQAGGGHMVGASTITQQVAKNFLLSSEQNIERKLKEAILAIRIERAFTKDQILELYLNEIKALNELSWAEAAYLALLPKAPSRYDPWKHAERALTRRNWVIDRIVGNGFATPEEGEQAKAAPLGVLAKKYGPQIHASEYFAEEVRREILDKFGEDKLYGGGLSVRTTLDPRLQAIARKALVKGLTKYDRAHAGWRGVDKTIEISGDWGKALAEIPVWKDIAPWKRAVVLEVSGDQATIGIRPGRDKEGRLVEERETGVIPASQVKWTRKSIKSALKPGDVIYVAPLEPKCAGGNGCGQVVAPAAPQGQRRHYGHGPAHGSRAGHRGRLQLPSEPVRPRHPSAASARLLVQAAHLSHGHRQRLYAVEHHRRRTHLCEPRPRHAALVPQELLGWRRRPLDLAPRHREVAQPDDGAFVAGYRHARHCRICEPLRGLRQSGTGARYVARVG